MEINWIHMFRTASMMCFASIVILSVVGYFVLLQPQIPLFYSLVRVEDQMVAKIWVFLFPGIAALSLAVERLISPLLSPDETSSRILSSGTTLVLLFLCTALIRIMVITL